MKALTTSTITAAAVAALVIAAPLAANAHVGVTPSSTAAGSPSVLTFSFSHGCEGSPTTSLTFGIPESVESVTPTVHPGWSIAETPTTVTYTANTPVADGLRDTVALSVVLPAGEEGDTVAFPVVQGCVDGEHAWTELAEGDAEPDSPAPTITLTAADPSAGGHGHGAATDSAETEEHATSAESASAEGSVDVVGRGLGIAGLVVGAVSIVIGLTARRRAVRS
ncbi:YcnI family copper-binding membrane protein [Salinibacterium hongtaonis]|uniref:YncI copper-binding domain-containing protein n=1 Tax=Homoserinimonas hongtaonis TaxID=2079791 RepID=A0A2U1SZF8_9MICO|nr:YcnI family protein [Salinibacterium hongtaonis]PWB96923.1 hypothetical protein DF220_03050 [Salinibacterium hongtaonis]